MARGRAIALCIVAMAGASATTGTAVADPGCGGLLQPSCPPPPPPPPQDPPPSEPPPPGQASVTLRASRSYAVFGPDEVKFSGKVTGAPEGTNIVLTSRSPAYGRSFLDVPGQTDSAGRFTFHVWPRTSATYRVVIDDSRSAPGRSNRVGVRVYPGLHVGFGHNDYGDPESISVTIDGPGHLDFKTGAITPRRGSARVGYFYGLPRHSKRAYKLGRGRLKVIDCDGHGDACELLAKWRLRPTARLRKARRVLACIRGTAFVGLGGGYSACGRDVIRLR